MPPAISYAARKLRPQYRPALGRLTASLAVFISSLRHTITNRRCLMSKMGLVHSGCALASSRVHLRGWALYTPSSRRVSSACRQNFGSEPRRSVVLFVRSLIGIDVKGASRCSVNVRENHASKRSFQSPCVPSLQLSIHLSCSRAFTWLGGG